MRGMKGQWEQGIDWQRIHLDKARQQHKPNVLQGYGENRNTEPTAAGANAVSLCVNESNICAGQSASTSLATRLIF